MHCLRLLALLLLAAPVFGADTGLEFSGVLTDGEKTRVALTDKAKGQTVWLETGGILNGYTFASYRPKDETVVLRRDGQDFPLRLTIAKSPEPARAATGVLGATLSLPPDPAPPGATAPMTGVAAAVPANSPATGPTAPPNANDAGAAGGTLAANAGPISGAPVDPQNPALVATTPIVLQPTSTIPGAANPAPTAVATVVPLPAQPTPAANPTDVASVPAPMTPVNALTATGPATSVSVRAGDTMEQISARTGVPLPQLQVMNPGVNPRSLKAGEVIRIR